MKENFGIYLITPNKIDLQNFKNDFERALMTNYVSYVQLRLKDCTDEILLESAYALLKITKNLKSSQAINRTSPRPRAINLSQKQDARRMF